MWHDEYRLLSWDKGRAKFNYMSDFYRLSHNLNVFIYKMGLLIPTSVRATKLPWTTLGKRELLEKYEQIITELESYS